MLAPAAWTEPLPRRRRRSGLGWLVVFGVITVAAVLGWRQLAPELDAELAGLDRWRPPTTVEVLDRGGVVVDRFSLVRRVWVPVDELPDVLLAAIVAAEDRRFYLHPGLDPVGILRAFVGNLSAGRIREGGSTITQQVVKNVLVGSERTFARKLREALLALRLEERLDKRRILELYVNLIYLGAGNYGVEAAARDYLGVSAREIDLAGAALLAGLVPAPSRASPRSDPELARERRDRVLDRLEASGRVSFEDAAAARRTPVPLPVGSRSPRTGGEAYRTEVRRELRRLLGERLPFEAGLRVHTALDPDVQRAAEVAVRAAAEAVEARQGPRIELDVGPDLGASTSTCGVATALGGGLVELLGERLRLDPEDNRRRVYNRHPSGWPQPFGALLRRGHRFEACSDGGRPRPVIRPYVEGAAVVLEAQSGRVIALVGGRDMPLEGFHRATQARRQAGSAFKPFVYGAAFDLGATQLDPVLDAPLALDAGHAQLWQPKNASGGYWGLVALRVAFAYSLNTAAVRLVMTHGTAPVIDRARLAGVRSPLRRDLTMALGTSEVSPIELAAGVAGIVRGGVAIEPHLLTRLVDGFGRNVARAGEPIRLPDADAQLPGGEGARFLEPASAWQVVELMEDAVERGTGRAASSAAERRGGKTGTSSHQRDAWFIGFARGHVVAVWLGQDDGETLGRGESGGRAALPAFTAIADALPRLPDPKPPKDVLPLPFGDRWVHVPADRVPPLRLPHSVPPLPEPLPEPRSP